jgi:hypothetical protein
LGDITAKELHFSLKDSQLGIQFSEAVVQIHALNVARGAPGFSDT